MRFQVKENDTAYGSHKYLVWDDKLIRIMGYTSTHSDGVLICEALNKQEAYTLEQMKLKFDRKEDSET